MGGDGADTADGVFGDFFSRPETTVLVAPLFIIDEERWLLRPVIGLVDADEGRYEVKYDKELRGVIVTY